MVAMTEVERKRISIVGTREAAQVALRAVLRRHFTVESVYSLHEVLALQQQFQPDAVIVFHRYESGIGPDGLLEGLRSQRLTCPFLVITKMPRIAALHAFSGLPLAGIFAPADINRLLFTLDCVLRTQSQRLSLPVARALGVIGEELKRIDSIPALASAVGVSASYLSHRFQADLHLGVRRLLRDIRLERATRLLLETDDTLQKVALQSGFSDASHLCRVVEKELGVRPGQLRRRWDGGRLGEDKGERAG
jgi:AraC-like DNA-binding protein